MNGLAQQYKGDVYVEYIDIENRANRRMVAEYGATSIPYIVILNDTGEISSIFRGLQSEATLRRAIEQALEESASNNAVASR
ncbi:MAG: hypothetical protein K8L97_14690 [Anaerolineae bacterium]|nr:hypothetical protein [Anaerolineae bacterium]